MDAHNHNNGSLEAKNGALEALQTSGRRFYHFEEELDPDLDPDPHSEKLDPDLDPH